ncbi:hypothetical protein [Paenibacillus sp. USDA918EY]|uniref:hypothetical protein n=1 Tax=Paenibacillus sp. USDA918EY TaxID=2689575 RepID=UPI0013588089|nr:hypothetical protein [Paenibacillus sp. USDA918EY]
MITYGIIGAVTISAGFLELRLRNTGNAPGAVAAKRFGRFFLLGAGIALSWQWIGAMIGLLH